MLTTLELPPGACYSEHCAAKFPYLLASAIAHWVGTWLQPGHCEPSAGSDLVHMSEGSRERLLLPKVSTAPTFLAARGLAGGQY